MDSVMQVWNTMDNASVGTVFLEPRNLNPTVVMLVQVTHLKFVVALNAYLSGWILLSIPQITLLSRTTCSKIATPKEQTVGLLISSRANLIPLS